MRGDRFALTPLEHHRREKVFPGHATTEIALYLAGDDVVLLRKASQIMILRDPL
jgi:hypothetical protein